MSQLRLSLTQQQLDGLREVAELRRIPVSSLLENYIDYLLKGGSPVIRVDYSEPSTDELTALAIAGGSFDWLRDEPNIYTWDDGEPI